MLYVANPHPLFGDGGSILGFAGNASGNVSPIQRIAGPKTTLGYDATSMAIDKLGRLYTTGTGNDVGWVYIWPSGSTGDVKPIASLDVCGDFPGTPMALTFDRPGHLWLACSGNTGTGGIFEFPRIAADAKGDITRQVRPLRKFSGTRSGQGYLVALTSIALNSTGQVSVEQVSEILTYAVKQNGQVTPLSVLSGRKTQLDGQAAENSNFSNEISYDSRGRLVVCAIGKTKARLLTFAPKANGNVAPISTLKVAGCRGIFIDSQDDIFVAAASSIAEYAAGATGSAPPIRVISGDLTGLTNATSIAFKK
jgi:sugar lactone lactonase YvrE